MEGGRGDLGGGADVRAGRGLRHAAKVALLLLVTLACCLLGVAVWELAVGRRGGTVLVLAGGGAKGAWQVGALRGLCEREEYRNAWNMISGTSIGALNAGILAQFPPQDQCAGGLDALEAYWASIRSTDDVWQTTQVPGRWDPFGSRECLDSRNLIAGGYGFFKYGGFCDPSPGTANYYRAVNATKIAGSGMRLTVVASSLRTGQATIFTERSPHILEACMASGAIAPLIYPRRIQGELFVDGGIFHNTPLVTALEGGVQRAIVVLLGELVSTRRIDENGTQGGGGQENVTGVDVLQYYISALTANLFDTRELREACAYFPDAIIEAVIPAGDVGSPVDFSPERVRAMMVAGRDFVGAQRGPVDACALVGVPRRGMMRRTFSSMCSWLPGASTFAYVGLAAGHPAERGSSASLLLVGLGGYLLGRRSVPRRPAGRH